MSEIRRILARLEASSLGSIIDWQKGDAVQVVEGPFEGFRGHIEGVSSFRSTLHTSLCIFGRHTPVELDFTQVEKLQEK